MAQAWRELLSATFEIVSNRTSTRRIRRGEARNMSMSMAPLLMHSEQVPAEAREAIRAAYDAPAQHRTARLEAAARVLHQTTGLECGDVRELVGLPGDRPCA
jgi:hypothetical protein